jgi:hypothetical protein
MTQELATRSVTPMELLQSAVGQGAGIDTIERLAKLASEMEDRRAAIEFDEALNRCQAKMKRIGADMTNPQTHSKYASYAALDRAIRPEYTPEGFSISFGEAEGSTADYIVMLAYLSRGGHTRTYRKGMPIDTKGPKGNDVMTKTHAAGSAGSYAKRYLLKDIFNLAVGEDDDDGNGAELSDAIKITVNAIYDCADMESLKEKYRKEYKAAVDANDSTAVKAFMDAYTKRKGELSQ